MQEDIVALQTATNFGRLMAVFLWIYGFMSPIAGIIADSVNKKWLIIGSLFIWSLVTFGMGFAQNFNQLYLLRALMGVSEALYIPAGLSLIAQYHQAKTRSLAIGIHMAGIYLGQALGGFGATVANRYSWQASFHIFGIIGMIYALMLIFFLKNSQTEHSPHSKSTTPQATAVGAGILTLLKNPSFWLILLYFAIPSLPGWAVKNWLPTLLANKLQISMTVAGPISTITTAMSSFLGVILGGLLSDRWVQKNIRGRVYTSLIGLLLTIPALILIGFGNNLLHAITASFCFGLGFGIFDTNNMPILCQFVSSKYRATAYGLMNFVGITSGAIITDWLGKSTDEGNLQNDFMRLAGLVFFVILLQFVFLRPKVQDFH